MKILAYATCGGVLRDEKGRWKTGFFKFIGTCKTVEAELWGVLEGLSGACNIDRMANLARTGDGRCNVWTSPPDEIKALLQEEEN
ncbi:hypothetical protein F3Y22_tig00117056pilonHSYRG00225 [Hibiscus syriacus]|uniref:RNase H type-1 domain-containing protein n=1 Tax=Hibiscus syriacus TaxID=106335 RepID=A0A6A2WVI3_HIBSY|nr:hypothetical protein F3Y22_tig00117056pilonHSYRG00225 [Hibiscus syriacus]